MAQYLLNSLRRFWAIIALFSNVILANPSHAQSYEMRPILETDFIYSAPKETSPRNYIGSILVPIKIKGIDKVFYMQLDTGSSYSMLYEKRLNSINAQHKVFDLAIIETKNYADNIALEIGGSLMSKNRFRLRDGGYDEKIDWDNPLAVNVVGTIGLDLISTGVIEIDFPAKKFILHAQLPPNYSGKLENELSIVRGMLLFHLKLDGRATKAVYDTGSSDYGLITTRLNFEKLRTKNAPITKTREKSFENFLEVETAPTEAILDFNGRQLGLRSISTVEGISFAQRMAMSLGGVSGIIGNRPFVNNILIIDLRQNKFGIAGD